ncbi:MAG: hypothetical protein MRJ65_16520 [Candidatus Brocadiaceae bacterium]|nr:hypothetical protein [Candidatus Brocadiaceae bacterium]
MPPLDDHFKNSKERTGKEYEALHHWLDDDKLKAAGTHDISRIPDNIQYVREKWGEDAVREFVLHIKEDMEHRMKENLQYFGLFK